MPWVGYDARSVSRGLGPRQGPEDETKESWSEDSHPRDQVQGWGKPVREGGGIKSISDVYSWGWGADLGGGKKAALMPAGMGTTHPLCCPWPLETWRRGSAIELWLHREGCGATDW